MLIEGQARAGNMIDGTGADVGVLIPDLVAAFERSFSNCRVGIFHETAALSHGAFFRLPVRKNHIKLHLSGNGIVQPAPPGDAVNAEFCGKNLLLGRHGTPCFLAHTIEKVFGVFQAFMRAQSGKVGFASFLERTLEFDFELGQFRFKKSILSGFALILLVAGIGRGEAADVTEQMRGARIQIFGFGKDGGPVANVVFFQGLIGLGSFNQMGKIRFDAVFE